MTLRAGSASVGIDGDVEGELLAGAASMRPGAVSAISGLGCDRGHHRRAATEACWLSANCAVIGGACRALRARKLDRALPQQQQDDRGRHQRDEHRGEQAARDWPKRRAPGPE